MTEKTTKEVKKETEFQKRILQLLIENGFKEPSIDRIAIMTSNDSEYANVSYNYMSTGINFPKNETSEQEVLDSGFKWWPTWHFRN